MPEPYPVTLSITPEAGPRNRATVLLRLFTALPHLILVGAPGFAMAGTGAWEPWALGIGGGGGLGAAAGAAAFISWFAIIFARTHPQGLWELAAMYMRWRVRAVAYMALFTDQYPPFGDADYPASFAAQAPPESRRRWSVGLRILYAIPHILLLAILTLAWLVTTIVAWFAILLFGRYPSGLQSFGTGVMHWSTRVEGYLLLMTDAYPPFRLGE
jgi:hypothetical protein